MINKERLRKIKQEITKRFPDFRGIEPEVVEKEIAPQMGVYRKLSLSAPKAIKRVFSLKFTKTVMTVDKVKIKRILLVTLDEEGEIIKISQSR